MLDRALATLTLLGALALWVGLLSTLEEARARFESREPWWWGYVQTGSHLGALLCVGFGSALAGMHGPQAFLWSVLISLCVYLSATSHGPRVGFAAGLIATLPVLIAPQWLDDSLGHLFRTLFPAVLPTVLPAVLR